MLEKIDRWANQWRIPMWEALYTQDEPAALKAIADARSAFTEVCTTKKVNDDAQLAVELLLGMMDTDTAYTFAPADARGEVLRERVGKLDTSHAGPLSKVMRARVLLTMRSFAHRVSGWELDTDVAESWLKIMDNKDVDNQCYTYLALWAYHIRNIELLKIAKRFYLLNPSDFMPDFARARFNVMMTLIRNKCKEEYVLELIELIPHPLHYEWFRNEIVPECKLRRVWNKTVEVRAKARRDQLLAEGYKVPPRAVQRTSFGM